MNAVGTLVHAPNSTTGRYDLDAAADSAGVEVRHVGLRPDGWIDLPALVDAAGTDVAYRCAGGPLAAAIADGAEIRLWGATARWFVDLDRDVTGRQWSLVDVPGAVAMLVQGPAFVKLAEAKFRSLPARRYRDPDDLIAALDAVHAPASLVLLATRGWLPIDSEYRVFTLGRDVVACSPYRVHDDPWTPLLRTHRASFHDEAAKFVTDLLADLPAADVPPTAVLDVARLDDGRFVVLEVNHVWSSGLYGCDPDAVLVPVLAAGASGQDERWLWRPDPAVAELRR